MSNTINYSGFLIGHLQSYCLACEIVEKNEDFEGHVLKEEHKVNLQKCTLLDGSNLESIRKVPKGYLCEQCNCLIYIIPKVKIHVTRPSHIKKSQSQALTPQIDVKQTSDGIIAFGCIKIDHLAWHAILNDTCLVCDTEVENANEHLNSDGHSIKLIQAPVFKKYYYLYRKIEDAVQCLTCNILIPETDLDGHLKSSDHQLTYASAQPSAGKSTKVKLPNYDLNKGLRINNFIRPCANIDKAMCLICDWFVVNDNINDHIRGFHHQSLLKLHNTFVKKKLEPQSVIESNKALEVEVKASTSSKDAQVCKDLARKEGSNNAGNQGPISESSKASKLQHETKEVIFPHAEEISEPEIDLNSNKNRESGLIKDFNDSIDLNATKSGNKNPESELIKDFNDSMDLNATKSAQEPKESSEQEAKTGQKKKLKKAKKKKKKVRVEPQSVKI